MIIWSKRAEASFNQITSYISEHFSQKEEAIFVSLAYQTIATIIDFPNAYPESKYLKNTRKAVIHPHSTLFYRIEKDNQIRLLLFWDNRQNPNKIKRKI